MRKFDAATDAPMDDKELPSSGRAVGDWRAVMVTLPLVAPVRELQAGNSTLPKRTRPYSELKNDEERLLAGAN